MSISHRQISDHLEKIIQELGGYEYLVNPFFRMSKATPVQTKKYRFVNYKFPIISLVTLPIFILPVIVFRLGIYAILSVLFSSQYVLFNTKIKLSKVIFISHAVGQNISSDLSDEFFALMPEYFQKRNIQTTILYTNHYRWHYVKNIVLLDSKKDKINRNLVPKFLKPNENIKYIREMFRLATNCLVLSAKKRSSNPVQSALLCKSLIKFFNRDSYGNYLLAVRLKDYYKERDPKLVALTFEGHSYEHYLIESVRSIKHNTLVILYQHSPIVLDHFGICSFLRTNPKNLLILSTGVIYQKYFKSISNTPQYKVIGSQKASSTFRIDSDKQRHIVLLTPDGGEIRSTITFIKLTKYLCGNQTIYQYVLRLHPHSKNSLIIMSLITTLKKFQNFTVSNNTLITDLNDAKFIFFRTSAVGLQALASGAVPVFYNDLSQKGLNALGLTGASFYEISKPFEALNLINKPNISLDFQSNKKIFNQLFSKLKYEKLEEIISIINS